MNFKPLGDNVLVERIPVPTTSKGGIVLTPVHAEKSTNCKVLAVGYEDVYDEKQDIFVNMPTIDVKVGATVLIRKASGQDLKWDDKDCVILSGEDILAVLEDETEVNPVDNLHSELP